MTFVFFPIKLYILDTNPQVNLALAKISQTVAGEVKVEYLEKLKIIQIVWPDDP